METGALQVKFQQEDRNTAHWPISNNKQAAGLKEERKVAAPRMEKVSAQAQLTGAWTYMELGLKWYSQVITYGFIHVYTESHFCSECLYYIHIHWLIMRRINSRPYSSVYGGIILYVNISLSCAYDWWAIACVTLTRSQLHRETRGLLDGLLTPFIISLIQAFGNQKEEI